MFADDINVLIIDRDKYELQQKINKVTTELETWFHRNNLVINIEKTVVIFFRSRQAKSPVKPQVRINGINLTYIPQTKLLGIYITWTLDWNTHINLLTTKLSKVVFIIKSTKGILTSQMALNIYFTQFQSLMHFGLLFWGGTGVEQIKRVFKIKKKGNKNYGRDKFKNFL